MATHSLTLHQKKIAMIYKRYFRACRMAAPLSRTFLLLLIRQPWLASGWTRPGPDSCRRCTTSVTSATPGEPLGVIHAAALIIGEVFAINYQSMTALA